MSIRSLTPWTSQQNIIIDAIINPTNHLITIEAVAGSAKSSTIVESVQRAYALNSSLRAEYTVFGTANASEAKLAFGHSCYATTIHSKAYQAIVKPYKLKLPLTGYLAWRDIPKTIDNNYSRVSTAIYHVEQFCTSQYTSLVDYTDTLDTPITPSILRVANGILEGLANGKIRATHSFYLKLYHILIMNGTIVLPELDILIADEAGDMTQISLDIFNISPAKQKILIGDSGQSIFGFMNLVSAFDYYKGQGLQLPLTKSFRVNSTDAKYIEQFCRDTFNSTLSFKGMEYPRNPQIKTSAYITRNNSTLISRMIQLEADNIQFRLSSKAKINQMFLWPLALIYLKPGTTQYNKELQHLQADADQWGSSLQLKKQYTLRGYILKHNENNQAIQAAHTLLLQYTPNEVLTAYNAAESHVHSGANHTLLTAHTSKGLTFDAVTLAHDINLAVSKALAVPIEDKTQDDIETFKLYYVAITRHRYELHNAVHLDKYKDEQ